MYLNNLINSKDSFLLYTYNDYCSLKIPCDDIFRSVMNKYKIDMCTNKQSLAHRGEGIFYVWTQKRWKKN